MRSSPNATPQEATDAGGVAGSGEQGVAVAQLEAGTMTELEPGEDVKFSEPADVGGNYEAVHERIPVAPDRGRGWACRTTCLPAICRRPAIRRSERASSPSGGCASRSSSASLSTSFARPTWRAFVEQAVLAGKLDARDYIANRDDYLAVGWHTPKWAWVDPEKDVKAEIMAIRAGLKARSMSINETGLDEEEVDAQIARDNERADRLGLVLDSDPRKTDARGQAASLLDTGDGGEGVDSGAPADSKPEPSKPEPPKRKRKEPKK